MFILIFLFATSSYSQDGGKKSFSKGTVGYEREKAKQESRYQCVDEFGKKVCGYNCKLVQGVASCEGEKSKNCVTLGNKTECGEKCRIEENAIRCD